MNCIVSQIENMIIEICRSTGCVCDKWIDKDNHYNIKKYDEENGTNRAEEYIKNCHSPIFIMKPPFGDKEWEFSLTCRGPLNRYEECSFSNDEALLILQNEFKNSWTHICNE